VPDGQSDYPSLPTAAQPSFLGDLEAFDMTPEMRDRLNFGNAHQLVPRMAKQVGLRSIPDEDGPDGQCDRREL
jgi:hypothetical protein